MPATRQQLTTAVGAIRAREESCEQSNPVGRVTRAGHERSLRHDTLSFGHQASRASCIAQAPLADGAAALQSAARRAGGCADGVSHAGRLRRRESENYNERGRRAAMAAQVLAGSAGSRANP